jgi:hypothetical protein
MDLTPTPKLNEALSILQGALDQPEKNKVAHYGKYADLFAIDKAIREANTNSGAGISYTQAIVSESDANGKPQLQIVTIINHKSGEKIAVEGLPVAVGTTSQQTMANATYAKRGSLAAAFGIVADEDDDGDSSSAVEAVAQKEKEVTNAIIAKLKETLGLVNKDKVAGVFGSVGKTPMTDSQLNNLSANNASALYGAAKYSLYEEGL